MGLNWRPMALMGTPSEARRRQRSSWADKAGSSAASSMSAAAIAEDGDHPVSWISRNVSKCLSGDSSFKASPRAPARMAMLIGTRRWSAVKARHEMPA